MAYFSARYFGGGRGSFTPPAPGLCIVRFVVFDRATPVPEAVVSAQIVKSNPTINTAILARVKHQAITNADGIADLVLVQQSEFTRGDGVYLIQVRTSTGKLLHNRYVTVPNFESVFSEALPEVLGYRA